MPWQTRAWESLGKFGTDAADPPPEPEAPHSSHLLSVKSSLGCFIFTISLGDETFSFQRNLSDPLPSGGFPAFLFVSQQVSVKATLGLDTLQDAAVFTGCLVACLS